MKIISRILILSCLIAGDAFSQDNPYGIPTDADLLYLTNEIEAVWDKGEGGIFTGERDVKISYMTFDHPQEIGAIAISSGRTESYIKYKEMIYTLYSAGYSVYIHDHRGQGFSERVINTTCKPPGDKPYVHDPHMGHVLDFDNYVLDLKTFYEQVIENRNHENLYLLGHSMGGGIATLYIQQYPTDFKAAALSSAMHEPKTVGTGTLVCGIAELGNIFRDRLEACPRYAKTKGPYEEASCPNEKSPSSLMTHSCLRFDAIKKLYNDNPQVKLGGPSAHWLANACNASKRMLNNTGEIEIPVLILQAENDVAVKASGQDEFCKNLASHGNTACESGAPVIIDGAYHELFIESDEYRIPAVTKILDFFAKVPVK